MSGKKRESNQRNALRSTGPSDTSLTRLNAIKHGFFANDVTVFDSEMYYPILERLRLELAPVGLIEELLVQRIALYSARLHRASTVVAEYVRAAGRRKVEDVSREPSMLDDLAAFVGGPVQRKGLRLSDLTDALKSLSEEILSIIESGVTDENRDRLMTSLDRFSSAVEALPERRNSDGGLRLIEELESKFQRYETQLENRLLKLLNEYERLVRMRTGEYVPPPMNVNVTVTPEHPE